MKVDVGLDPDVLRHGVAIYQEGQLVDLKMLNTVELYVYLTTFHKKSNVTLHIEDVRANKAVWHAQGMSRAAAGMAAQHVGECKQAQRSVEQMAEVLGIPVKKYRVSKRWKKGAEKSAFEKVTGWTGRSNEDNRSAAFMGYLGVTSSKK